MYVSKTGESELVAFFPFVSLLPGIFLSVFNKNKLNKMINISREIAGHRRHSTTMRCITASLDAVWTEVRITPGELFVAAELLNFLMFLVLLSCY